MENMQENEFAKIKATCEKQDCSHQRIVKLYDLGAHSDYGCLDCKMMSLILDDFKRTL